MSRTTQKKTKTPPLSEFEKKLAATPRPDWLDYTPLDCSYRLVMTMEDKDAGVSHEFQDVPMSREEFMQAKEYLFDQRVRHAPPRVLIDQMGDGR